MTHEQKVDYATGLSDTALCAYALNDPSREHSEIAKAELTSRRSSDDWLPYCQQLLPAAAASMARQRSQTESSQALIDRGLCTMKGGVMTSYGCELPDAPVAPQIGTTTRCDRIGNQMVCRSF